MTPHTDYAEMRIAGIYCTMGDGTVNPDMEGTGGLYEARGNTYHAPSARVTENERSRTFLQRAAAAIDDLF
jgi:hypothetical protein